MSAAARMTACSAGLLIARSRPTTGASGRRFDELSASSAISGSERAGASGERYFNAISVRSIKVGDLSWDGVP